MLMRSLQTSQLPAFPSTVDREIDKNLKSIANTVPHFTWLLRDEDEKIVVEFYIKLRRCFAAEGA